MTIAVSAGGWLLFGKPVASAKSLTVSQVELSADTLPVGSLAKGYATITLTNKETQTPKAGVWVGLRIADTALRTAGATYYDWYSPEPERAFFQTDNNGQLKLPLKSEIAGPITYQVFTANPEIANDAKYQSLDYSFTVDYVGDDSPAI